MTNATAPTPITQLLRQLEPQQLRQRIRELEDELKMLRLLLRTAQRRQVPARPKDGGTNGGE